MAAVTPLPPTTADDVKWAKPPRGSLHARRRLRLNLFRWTTFTIAGVFFLVPLYAMVRFSFVGIHPGEYNLDAWRAIVTYPGLLSAIEITLELAAITCVIVIALLVPTMIWVRLRVQWLGTIVEAICLLPLSIPAIVLVVGLAPIYRYIRQTLSLSALMLFWAYVILALPYVYRALAAGLDALDVKTLSEAARSLGASWFTVMWRVIVPNMKQALLNAVLLAAALVLGEFTIALVLLYVNLQVALYDISRAVLNAGVVFSTSAASLLFAFLLLLIISFVGGRRRKGRS